MRHVGRHGLVAATLGVLALTFAGCGGGGDGDGVATLGGASGNSDGGSDEESDLEPEEAAQKFAECMRDQGIDMPDPEVGEDGGFAITAPVFGAGEADPAKLEEAHAACEHFLEEAIPEGERPDPEEQARMREQALAMAQCMRDEGFDWPDPEFGEGGRITQMIGPDQGIDPSDPKVQEAMDRCADKAGLPKPGEGGGGTVRSGSDEKSR
jgi:hypothetical protein